jgi:hypothetical protein
MADLAGLVILGASVLLPVGLARAALGFIVATLGHGSNAAKPPAPPDSLG